MKCGSIFVTLAWFKVCISLNLRGWGVIKKYLNQFVTGMSLVVVNPIDWAQPTGVGLFNGSSCVTIGKTWAIATKHQGGGTWAHLRIQGEVRTVLQYIPHPTADLALIEFSPPVVSGWHPVRETIEVGDTVYMGGFGRWAVPGGEWQFPMEERWGSNKAAAVSLIVSTTYTAPESSDATENEAQFALNDSGGGLFSLSDDGALYLEAIAMSVYARQWGYANYNDASHAIKLAPYIPWIYSVTFSGADWNRSGDVSVDDIFAFLDSWFSQNPRADLNQDAIVAVDDIFVFLNRWHSNPVSETAQ